MSWDDDENTLTDPLSSYVTKPGLAPSFQELIKCACPAYSTATGCMQIRHPPSTASINDPEFDFSDEEEECQCQCHAMQDEEDADRDPDDP